MTKQHKYVTNLFCLIGKPGTGKQAILDNIFSNARFVDKYELSKFVSGTTKEIRETDYDISSYDRYTIDEYHNIFPAEIIESRSYDDVVNEKVYHCFTRESHIGYNKNKVGIMTPFQYIEIKKWAQITQMENLMREINLYPIYIESPLQDRLKRLIMNFKGDDNYLYDICSKIISERYHYRSDIVNSIIDIQDSNVLYIDAKKWDNKIDEITEEVRQFIIARCKEST